MIKYLDIILRKLGLVRAAVSDAQIAKLNATIDDMKGFQAEIVRCSAGNAVGMYG